MTKKNRNFANNIKESSMRVKKTLWLFATLILFCGMPVNAQDTEEYKPFFHTSELPDLLKWLPAPPDSTSEAFVHDIMRYMWGKTQRLDSVRAAIAKRDAIWQLDTTINEYSGAFGMRISKEETPEIYKFLVRGVTTCDKAGSKAKRFYQRKRPFMVMNEHMLSSWEEEGLRTNGSYPSGHTIRGWSLALLMMEINPEATDTILARGMMYGDSRVIVGAHWQSDVDAGRLAASAAVIRLHTSPEFMEQLAKAKAEFRFLKYGIRETNKDKRRKSKK